MASRAGKKVRKVNPRRSLDAEMQVLRTIEKIADAGGLLPGGYFDRGVIEDLYTSITSPKAGTTTREARADLWLHETGKAFKAKRWYDTTARFRKYMLLYGVKGDPATHRPLTIWIGKEMIEASRRTGKPLAAMLRKSIYDRLRRLLGTDQFGFWINIENSEKAPYALHAHGLLYVRDARYLVRPSDERSALVEELRIASGDDFSKDKSARVMTVQNWVRFTQKDLNVGWITYCRKARRGRWFKVSAGEPPADVGTRLEAGTHNLTRQASAFYDRARLVFRAMANDQLPKWTDDDWKLVTGIT